MLEFYIDNDEALADYLTLIEPEVLLGIDTEFVREKTYYPQLCLMQLASPTSIACVDCLASFDLSSLLNRLLRDDCAWIVHSSRQDLEVIYQHTEDLPKKLIDTQVAAGLVGYAPQIGLQDLLQKVLGVRLEKEYTRTDWSARPLPAAALAYARDDVRSLNALWAALAARLEALGRGGWLQQDCTLLLREPPVVPPEQIWARLKGLRALDPAGRAAALSLVVWREERARSRNRPRRWILADDQLLALARSRPQSPSALRALTELPQRLVQRAGSELLAALAAGASETIRKQVAELAVDELPDKRRLRDAQTRVKKLAEKLGVSAEVLATKQEVVDSLLGREPPRIASTWRRPLLREIVEAVG